MFSKFFGPEREGDKNIPPGPGGISICLRNTREINRIFFCSSRRNIFFLEVGGGIT